MALVLGLRLQTVCRQKHEEEVRSPSAVSLPLITTMNEAVINAWKHRKINQYIENQTLLSYVLICLGFEPLTSAQERVCHI